jgi:DNA-binding winged helix-turn-helix (wHTH) protein
MIRTFGDFELDDSLRKLSRGGQTVRLTGQALDLLCFLVERSGELITREEIKRQLWPDTNVELEHSIDVLINRLRSALGDSGKSPRYIETVPRKGYRFLGPVGFEHHGKDGTAIRKRIRLLGTYAAIAVLAAITALLIVHARYDKFVPRHHSPISPAASAR